LLPIVGPPRPRNETVRDCAHLVGLTAGQATTLTVPPERAYGLSDPGRVRRRPRRRFPEHATIRPGDLVRFIDARGRRRLVRILQADGETVVVDANHRWADQTLELEVRVVAVREPDASSNVPNAEPGGGASPAGKGGRPAGRHAAREENPWQDGGEG
jgi:FKBP-type peptidyl-prolyl cis-trans isomerase 2